MKAQQFVDSLNIVVATFEMETTKLLSRNKSVPDKIQLLTMHLLSFKSSILKCFNKLLQPSLNKNAIEEANQKIKHQVQDNEAKLKKYELHTLLKRKIHKIHQQSMMNSILVEEQERSMEEDPAVAKLRNSLLLIEKDLGIQDEFDNYSSGISSVVHRSMASLQATPIRSKIHNDSIVSSVSLGIENEDGNKKEEIEKEMQEKPPLPKNLPKRKKKAVEVSRQKVLGNLLEETYNSCLQNFENP